MNRWRRLLISTFLILTVLSPVSTPLSAQVAPSAYDPNVLSYGLYWFGLDNASQKFVPGEANPYFDPARPTLIFAHGWQRDLSAANPPDFTYAEGGGVNTANAWIDDGWNIGVFYWNQFADEAVVADAETKIWVNDGLQRMRWRKGGAGYEEAPPGTPSAAELFYRDYVAAMTEQNYTGGHIRIAGHSLGSQMAVYFTKLVSDGIAAGDVSRHLLPTRVALLDPYWSNGAKSYLDGKKIGEMVREYVAELLPTSVLFEWYRSSTLPVDPDANQELQLMTLYSEMIPDFVSDYVGKHSAGRDLYFWSYAFAGPPECNGDACLISPARMLSRVSDARLAALMRSDYIWAQVAGTLTSTPDDDTYQSNIRADAPYSVTQLIASPATQTVGGVITLTATVEDKNNAQVGDGILVTFGTDLGTISTRSVTSSGAAIAHLTSVTSGVAHVTATTRGTGGTIQNTASVTFSGQ